MQVDVTTDDVQILNHLHAANTGHQLYFNAAITEHEVRRLLTVVTPQRRATRASVKTYPGQAQADGSSSVLVHSSKTDLRMGPRLSNVSELKSAIEYRLSSRVMQIRDPFLRQLRHKFLKKLEARQYRISEFGTFIGDKRMEDESR